MGALDTCRRQFLIGLLDGYRREKTKWLEDGLRIKKKIAETKEKIRMCDDEQRAVMLAKERMKRDGGNESKATFEAR